MLRWMKTLAASACILTILLHLIPENRFANYVRFYAGLLFFLIAAGPLLEFMGSADNLERLLQLEFLKEDYENLESAAEGLSELKNETIQEAFQTEIERQITEIASAYGLTVLTAQLDFGEDGYLLEAVTVQVRAEEGLDSEMAVSETKSEIAGLYQVPLSAIEMIVQS
ncbi:MAG: stage III sporulation protein AF [Lachnospiraceae bacterium]|nr:stage III sporulation protein AF [Lachnospiraceae bacterium]